MRYIYSLLLVLFSLQSFALDKDLGKHKKFFTHMYKQGKHKVCNAYSQPSARASVKRAKIPSINITNRPYKKSKNKLAVDMGLVLKKGSVVLLRTKTKTYKLFSHENYAFAHDTQERNIIKALKKSNKIRITAYDQNNQRIIDTYSMQGVTKAIRTIDRACRKP